MATKKAGSGTTGWSPSPKKKRPGVHAKTKRSASKGGKNWVKAYRGQGR
jgi:hypothetical protein